MDEVDWKVAYQVEREEHKKTLLILDKAMEESNRVFVKTRDLIRFLEEITEQSAPPQPAPNSSTSRRRYKYD